VSPAKFWSANQIAASLCVLPRYEEITKSQNQQPDHPLDNGTTYPSEIEDKNKW
jgi:hypothetical protein